MNKANNKCELCGWGEVNPYSGKISLEIHHIDGNCLNNTEDNLQVLCPNCHSLTQNFKALNKEGRDDCTVNRKSYCIDCGTAILSASLRCHKCANKLKITEKPITREQLKSLIRTTSFTKIGEIYGVTDNAIRKWCIGYNLPFRKKDIASYSEKEWNNI